MENVRTLLNSLDEDTLAKVYEDYMNIKLNKNKVYGDLINLEALEPVTSIIELYKKLGVIYDIEWQRVYNNLYDELEGYRNSGQLPGSIYSFNPSAWEYEEYE